MSDTVDIMVVATSSNDRLHWETYDTLAFARQLQALRPGAVGVWILGADVAAAARDIASQSGVPVTAVRGPGLGNYMNETHCAVLAAEIARVKPAFVCTAHTSQGWEWAPALAARIGAGCICAVDGLSESRGRICFQKDLYGGKVKGLYTAGSATTLITVQPGIFQFDPPSGVSPEVVILKSSDSRSERIQYQGTRQAGVVASDITSTAIIIAAGNGIGEEAHMALIHGLAELLPKAAVAGTRIICDRGWLGYDRQVGVTGATVAPDLYVACGISGAAQHVVGMQGARFVVAINTDPRAPIFNEADVSIVEDIVGFIPLIEEALGQITP